MYKKRITSVLTTPPIVVDCDKDSMLFRSPEPTDMFYTCPCIGNDDGVSSVQLSNPLRMLLNQKRLDELRLIGDDNAEKWYNQLKQNSQLPSELNELTKDCTPQELMTMIRSRHIQSYSELNNWCIYMHDNYNEFEREVIRTRDILAAEEAAKKKQVVKQEGAAT